VITTARRGARRIDASDLGAALKGVYRLFRREADKCPVGPLVNAADCLEEAMRQFGCTPPDTEEPAGPFHIVEIGSARGGDTRLLKVGLTREVVGPAADGGPELIAACPDQDAAERVMRALELLDTVHNRE
jgi:hypothetical protein